METPSPEERWQEVRQLFDEVIELPPSVRAGYLERHCTGDDWLRREVLSLVSAYEGSADFLGLGADTPEGVRVPVEASPTTVLRAAGREALGSYEVVRELGRGGMGEVYLARDTGLDRLVALKFLPPHLSSDEEAKARLVAEARSAAAVDHPNVATVYEIGEAADGRVFLAMAYCEGETLRSRIARGALAVDEAIGLALQIASGLHAAHRRGVIHRDVKPSNILIPLAGPLKIVDFGLAKRAGGHPTQAGVARGTIAYMSPEQVRGEELDPRTDLWSLGVVLYEMLAGRLPFGGEHEAAILHAILHADPVPLPQLRPEVPFAVWSVVRRALARRREERHPDAGVLLAELEQALRAAHPGAPAADGGWPATLPVPPTELVGRRRELEEIERLVGEDGVRLLTLTGTGGTGKTRLVLSAAAGLSARFPDGVRFVSLAPVSDAALVGSTAARALGIREMGGAAIRDSLVGFLRERRALLVFDNFEHVVEAAPLVADLLAACPALVILVTSRVPLRLQGEHEYPVRHLALPGALDFASPDRLSVYDSVALFVARARAVRPGFALTEENARPVAELCVRLDGLPLAIELAAARVKVLSPKAIVARLQDRFSLLTDGGRDRPARHRTLREAIAWSYDLLGPSDQALFRLLSVFAGGFSLEAAEAVCAATERSAVDVLAGVSSLVDQSLLRQEEQPNGELRFFMLETIREFALQELRRSGQEASVRRAHVHYYLELARKASEHLTGSAQAEWFDLLEVEHNNLRSAQHFALSHGRATAAQFVALLWRFYFVRGFINEGYERAAHVLAEAGAELDPSLRAKLLMATGLLASNAGLFEAGRAMLDETLALMREVGLEADRGEALSFLGWTLLGLGEYALARAVSEEGLHVSRALGRGRSEGTALNNLGFAALLKGNYRQAVFDFEESVHVLARLDDRRAYMRGLTNLGLAMHRNGRLEEAAALHAEALSFSEAMRDPIGSSFSRYRLLLSRHELGDSLGEILPYLEETLSRFEAAGHNWGLMECYPVLGEVLLNAELLDRVAPVVEAHLERAREIAFKPGIALGLCRLGYLEVSRGRAERGIDYCRQSLRQRAQLEEEAGLAESLEELAGALLARSDAERAARLVGAARAIRDRAGAPVLPRARPRYEARLTALEAQLGSDALAEALEAGRRLEPGEAAALGLEGAP